MVTFSSDPWPGSWPWWIWWEWRRRKWPWQGTTWVWGGGLYEAGVDIWHGPLVVFHTRTWGVFHNFCYVFEHIVVNFVNQYLILHIGSKVKFHTKFIKFWINIHPWCLGRATLSEATSPGWLGSFVLSEHADCLALCPQDKNSGAARGQGGSTCPLYTCSAGSSSMEKLVHRCETIISLNFNYWSTQVYIEQLNEFFWTKVLKFWDLFKKVSKLSQRRSFLPSSKKYWVFFESYPHNQLFFYPVEIENRK